MLEELGLKKLQERRSIAKLKMLHSFYHSYKFVTPSLLPSKARKTNVSFKSILGCMRLYEGSFYPYTVSFWSKLPPHIANTISMEQFSDYVPNLDLQRFA